MTATTWDEALTIATEDVLESMFFLSPDGPATADIPDRGAYIQRELQFLQPDPGTFGIRASRGDARIFAANFLGEDPQDIEEESLGEVVGEMANIICGNMLARLHPAQSAELTSPASTTVGTEELSSARVLRSFSFEGHSLTVWAR